MITDTGITDTGIIDAGIVDPGSETRDRRQGDCSPGPLALHKQARAVMKTFALILFFGCAALLIISAVVQLIYVMF